MFSEDPLVRDFLEVQTRARMDVVFFWVAGLASIQWNEDTGGAVYEATFSNIEITTTIWVNTYYYSSDNWRKRNGKNWGQQKKRYMLCQWQSDAV